MEKVTVILRDGTKKTFTGHAQAMYARGYMDASTSPWTQDSRYRADLYYSHGYYDGMLDSDIVNGGYPLDESIN